MRTYRVHLLLSKFSPPAALILALARKRIASRAWQLARTSRAPRAGASPSPHLHTYLQFFQSSLQIRGGYVARPLDAVRRVHRRRPPAITGMRLRERLELGLGAIRLLLVRDALHPLYFCNTQPRYHTSTHRHLWMDAHRRVSKAVTESELCALSPGIAFSGTSQQRTLFYRLAVLFFDKFGERNLRSCSLSCAA
jgi:hypothetical protein